MAYGKRYNPPGGKKTATGDKYEEVMAELKGSLTPQAFPVETEKIKREMQERSKRMEQLHNQAMKGPPPDLSKDLSKQEAMKAYRKHRRATKGD